MSNSISRKTFKSSANEFKGQMSNPSAPMRCLIRSSLFVYYMIFHTLNLKGMFYKNIANNDVISSPIDTTTALEELLGSSVVAPENKK